MIASLVRVMVSEGLGDLVKDDRDQPARVPERSSGAALRTVWLGAAVLLATAAVEAVVTGMSGSVGVMADAVHNFADALTALPLGLAFVLGRRPPSRRFSYGLGRSEDLAGLAMSVLIAASTVVAVLESVSRLEHPRPVRQVGAVLAAGLIGFAGNQLVAGYRIRVGRRIGSAALIADGLHARTDGLASLGVAVAALGAAAGWQRADPVIGLAIAASMLAALVAALRGVGHRLLDGVDPCVRAHGEAILAAVPGVLAVVDLRLRWVGHVLHGDASIAAAPDLDLTRAHALAHAAEQALSDGIERLGQVSVHVEPSPIAVAAAA